MVAAAVGLGVEGVMPLRPAAVPVAEDFDLAGPVWVRRECIRPVDRGFDLAGRQSGLA
jgi:hypothetical protein